MEIASPDTNISTFRYNWHQNTLGYALMNHAEPFYYVWLVYQHFQLFSIDYFIF